MKVSKLIKWASSVLNFYIVQFLCSLSLIRLIIALEPTRRHKVAVFQVFGDTLDAAASDAEYCPLCLILAGTR